MFKKLVAIEPVNITPECKSELVDYAEELTFYDDMPKDNGEIIRRIGDADAVLVSYTSRIDGEVLKACPGVRYVGMCCSLYAPEAANVDIRTADSLGIVVKGVRDYGDEGVPEYVVSELVRLLHGFGGVMWKDAPMELTGVNIGVMGLGTSGTFVARALRFFGANVYYYTRTRKEDLEEKLGLVYLSKEELLKKVDILCTCLNKNVILLDEEAFKTFGDGKILVNTSIAPSHEIGALKKWLKNPGNFALCDTVGGLGDPELASFPNVFCGGGPAAGTTSLAKVRLSRKVIDNIKNFLENR